MSNGTFHLPNASAAVESGMSEIEDSFEVLYKVLEVAKERSDAAAAHR